MAALAPRLVFVTLATCGLAGQHVTSLVANVCHLTSLVASAATTNASGAEASVSTLSQTQRNLSWVQEERSLRADQGTRSI